MIAQHAARPGLEREPLLGEADLLDQGTGAIVVFEQHVSPEIDREAARGQRPHPSARVALGLEHLDDPAGLNEAPRGRQPGDARADDADAPRAAQASLRDRST